MIYCYKIGVRSDRLCILGAGLLGAFVTVVTCGEPIMALVSITKNLCVEESKMMTAWCPVWAHTYQTMCLEFRREQLRPEAFRLQEKCHFACLRDYCEDGGDCVSFLSCT